MKNLIYIFVLCSSYIGGYSQEFPTIYTTEACQESYTGSIEITFQHDMTSYPLLYNASYYNETEGLFHPDDGGAANDGLDGTTKNDEYNFMNSGNIYNCCTKKKIDEYRLRKYQWKYVRDGKSN